MSSFTGNINTNDSISKLIFLIIEELYSKDVAEVAFEILLSSGISIHDLSKRLNKPFHLIRDSLIVLSQKKLITIKNQSISLDINDISYHIDVNRVLNNIKNPKILYYIHMKYGKIGKEIVDSMMINGNLTYSMTSEFVDSNLNLSKQGQFEYEKEKILIKRIFLQLIKENIIKRTVMINSTFKENCLSESDFQIQKQVQKQVSPKGKKDSNKKSKKSKIQYDNDDENVNNDNQILNNIDNSLLFDENSNEEYYFSLDYKKLIDLLRIDSFLDLISKKINTQIGFLCKVFVEYGSFNFDLLKTTKPLSTFELCNINKDLLKINLDELIKNMKADDHNLIKVYGTNEIGKEVYIIDFNYINQILKEKIIEKILTQSLSNIHARIYRLLNKTGPLDLKNIMEICMISQKDCSTLLNQLIVMNFIDVQEVNIKGSNMAIFRVSQVNVKSNVENLIYKIIYNLKCLLRNLIKNQDIEEIDEVKVKRIYGCIAELDGYLMFL